MNAIFYYLLVLTVFMGGTRAITMCRLPDNDTYVPTPFCKLSSLSDVPIDSLPFPGPGNDLCPNAPQHVTHFTRACAEVVLEFLCATGCIEHSTFVQRPSTDLCTRALAADCPFCYSLMPTHSLHFCPTAGTAPVVDYGPVPLPAPGAFEAIMGPYVYGGAAARWPSAAIVLLGLLVAMCY